MMPAISSSTSRTASSGSAAQELLATGDARSRTSAGVGLGLPEQRRGAVQLPRGHERAGEVEREARAAVVAQGEQRERAREERVRRAQVLTVDRAAAGLGEVVGPTRAERRI